MRSRRLPTARALLLFAIALGGTSAHAIPKGGKVLPTQPSGPTTVHPGDSPIADVAAHYRLDGNAKDSAWGQVGTISGATQAPDRHGCAARAFAFDGDDKISLPVAFVREHFTIAFDVRVDDKPDAGPYCQAPCAYTGRAILGRGGLQIGLGDWGGGASYTHLVVKWRGEQKTQGRIFRDINLHLRRQHHVTVVYEQPTMRIYVDGAPIKTLDGVTPPIAQDVPMILGMSESVEQAFIGVLDDVRVFNKALSTDEVKALVDQVKSPGLCPPVGVSPTKKSF